MGMYRDRAVNVNIESDLLNISRRVTNYPCNKYVPKCSDCDVPKCDIDLPFCKGLQKHAYPTEYNNNSVGYKNANENVRLQYTNNKMGDLRKCEWDCVNVNERSRYNYSTMRKPYYVRELPKPLEVGPERKDQRCESLWNNVTKRRSGLYITGLKNY